MNCIATSSRDGRCLRTRDHGSEFCTEHKAAPATRRGGWLSAARRKWDVLDRIDASSVAPRLWVGAEPPFDIDLPKVDVLVLCAQELQPPQLAFHGHIIRCPLPDSRLSALELRRARDSALAVSMALVQQQRVLVTCAQGINRSAFVASLALGRITRLSGSQLIDLMRRRRHYECLSNEHFCALLHKLVPGTRRRAPARTPTRQSTR